MTRHLSLHTLFSCPLVVLFGAASLFSAPKPVAGQSIEPADALTSGPGANLEREAPLSPRGLDPAAPTNPVAVGPGGRLRREDPRLTVLEEERPFHIHTLWESRYVSEGRDNLDGESLLSASTEASYGPFTFAPWFGYGPESDYTELNLNFVLGTNIGENLELYVAYTHLRFPRFNLHDNEVGAGLVYTGLGFFDVGAVGYYSFAADGAFFDVVLSRNLTISDRLTVTPRVVVGFNAGYIPLGHDGANNVSAGAELAYRLNSRLELTGFAGYNFAIDSDPSRFPEDEFLNTFFWGAAGVKIHF